MTYVERPDSLMLSFAYCYAKFKAALLDCCVINLATLYLPPLAIFIKFATSVIGTLIFFKKFFYIILFFFFLGGVLSINFVSKFPDVRGAIFAFLFMSTFVNWPFKF